jgi:hypothetical protein
MRVELRTPVDRTAEGRLPLACGGLVRSSPVLGETPAKPSPVVTIHRATREEIVAAMANDLVLSRIRLSVKTALGDKP